MLLLGPLLDLEGPKPESWRRRAKTQTVEVHFLQGNQRTLCLRLEQPEHTAGIPLPSLSGREESQPLHHPLPKGAPGTGQAQGWG